METVQMEPLPDGRRAGPHKSRRVRFTSVALSFLRPFGRLVSTTFHNRFAQHNRKLRSATAEGDACHISEHTPGVEYLETHVNRGLCVNSAPAATFGTPPALGEGYLTLKLEPDLYLQVPHRLSAGGGAEAGVPRLQTIRIDRSVR